MGANMMPKRHIHFDMDQVFYMLSKWVFSGRGAFAALQAGVLMLTMPRAIQSSNTTSAASANA